MKPNEHDIFRATLEQLPEGIIIVDADDEIIFVNRAAEEIRGVARDRILGRSVILCHPQKSHDRVRRALQFLREGRAGAFVRMVADTRRGKHYENTYAAIRDKRGNYIGSVVISRDVTERRRLEEEKAVYLQNLEQKVAQLTAGFEDMCVSAMTSLVNALEAKDPYTKGHSLRVSETASRMAEHVYGVSPEAREVQLAGMLHDIGKVGLRESVLHKPGRLTPEEFEHVKEHPVIGERILLPIERFRGVAKLARHHHERFDGMGYPDGLKGKEIPEGARILAIADSYDAMTSDRPYRGPMEPERAAEEIKKNLGSQFDPEWGRVFLELFYSGTVG